MIFEEEYHPNLRHNIKEKAELLNESISTWLGSNGDLIGEIYGVPNNGKTVYCCSTTILKPYQHKGFGKILKAYWLGKLASKGFREVEGHANSQSLKLNKFFDAMLGEMCDNWYNTGESYQYYVIRL